MTQRSLEELAMLFFNRYNEQGPNPWKTFDGRDVPRWDALGVQVQAKWMAVAALSVEIAATISG